MEEIKLKKKYLVGGKSGYGSTSGGAGNKKAKRILFRGEREAAQEATAANKHIKLLQPNGKTKFVRT